MFLPMQRELSFAPSPALFRHLHRGSFGGQTPLKLDRFDALHLATELVWRDSHRERAATLELDPRL